MAELAISAMGQIQKQVDKSLEPKLEKYLARKVKTNALKTKPIKKEQHCKLKSNPASTKEQFAKKESHVRNFSVDSESTVAPSLIPLTMTTLSLVGKASLCLVGKFSQRGNCKPVFEPLYDCYGIDVAPMNIFENQVIPFGIPNISKSFTPNLDTI